MDKDALGSALFFAGFCFVFLLVGIISGGAAVMKGMRRQAIENGAARYVCDPETGATTFEWLTKPKGERE